MQSLHDQKAFYINGFVAILLIILVSLSLSKVLGAILGSALFVGFLIIIITGFTVIKPNEAKVLTFFGRYIGTIQQSGFLWTVPFSSSITIPLKIINFNTEKIKVNDLCGNPIDVGAVVVWKVSDAAQACFNVDDYRAFIFNQSESILRTIIAKYPYDSSTQASLRGNSDEITKELTEELQQKLSLAGIQVQEVKLSHLSYAAEIATSMLKRQQAMAMLEARKYLVENAVTIVESVITSFEKNGAANISDDKKAEIMSNIMVTLISEKEVSPVIGV